VKVDVVAVELEVATVAATVIVVKDFSYLKD